MISWELCGGMIRKIQPRYRPSVKKLIWEEIPTRVKLVRYGFEEDEKCPLCGQRDDGRNFGGCSNVKLKKERERIIGNMKTGMRSEGVNPFFVDWFIKVIHGETSGWEEV